MHLPSAKELIWKMQAAICFNKRKLRLQSSSCSIGLKVICSSEQCAVYLPYIVWGFEMEDIFRKNWQKKYSI